MALKQFDDIPKVAEDLRHLQIPVLLDNDDLEALREGKYLEIVVNEGAYQVYLNLDRGQFWDNEE